MTAVVVVLANGANAGELKPEVLGEIESLDGVEWSRRETDGAMVCLAAHVVYAAEVPLSYFRVEAQGWAMRRGWSVTVAPV